MPSCGRHTECNTRGDLALSLTHDHLMAMALHAREHGLEELQTGFAVTAMDSMGNRGKNLRDGTYAMVAMVQHPTLNHGEGMTGITIKNFNGHKGHEGDTLFSACVPNRNPPLCAIGYTSSDRIARPISVARAYLVHESRSLLAGCLAR